MDKHIVAVYGTLLSGFQNHWLLKDEVLLGRGKGNFHGTMCTAGHFPYFTVEEPDAKPVVELYLVDDQCLRSLDGLEGHPDWYKRELRSFTLENGEQTKAWIYIMPDPTNTLIMGCELVPDGDWKAYRSSK